MYVYNVYILIHIIYVCTCIIMYISVFIIYMNIFLYNKNPSESVSFSYFLKLLKCLLPEPKKFPCKMRYVTFILTSYISRSFHSDAKLFLRRILVHTTQTGL